jgi:phage baseplate assembly protein W
MERIDLLAAAIGNDVGFLLKDYSPETANQIAAKLSALERVWKDGFSGILATQGALQQALAELQAAQAAGQAAASTGAATIPATTIMSGSRLPANFVFGHNGINRNTGKGLTGWLHCAQSIHDILATPVGTRVMRRDYGSRIPDLMDKPMTQDTLFEATAAAAVALETWEPRFRLKLLALNAAGQDGRMSITVKGTYYPRGHLGDFTAIEDYGDLVIRV